MVSLLKEYFGEHATAENDFGFDLLPRISGTTARTARSWTWSTVEKVFGYFLLGQNPAVGSAHGKLQRLGMANLDWVVVRDLAMIESATFWKDSPEIETGEIVRRSAARRCSSSPPPRTSRRRARSPRPSAWCSGATRPATRPAISARTCGSSTTWAG